jgi:TrmH family RNA methyltransferase
MGSFLRVQVWYSDLVGILKECPLSVYGTFLEGENVHRYSFGKGGVVVIGNEAHGISGPVAELVDVKITIPRVGEAESLNAAVAAAVVCDNIRRNT